MHTAAQTSCFAKRKVCSVSNLCVRPLQVLNFSLDHCELALKRVISKMSRVLPAEGTAFGFVFTRMQSPAFK